MYCKWVFSFYEFLSIGTIHLQCNTFCCNPVFNYLINYGTTTNTVINVVFFCLTLSGPLKYSSWFSSNFESFASELPENHEDYFHSDGFSMFI